MVLNQVNQAASLGNAAVSSTCHISQGHNNNNSTTNNYHNSNNTSTIDNNNDTNDNNDNNNDALQVCLPVPGTY